MPGPQANTAAEAATDAAAIAWAKAWGEAATDAAAIAWATAYEEGAAPEKQAPLKLYQIGARKAIGRRQMDGVHIVRWMDEDDDSQHDSQHMHDSQHF